jgi:hypothetical protein
MGYILLMHTVIESSIFEAEKSRYWSDEEFLEFASWIACHAKAGEVVPGSGGVRKIRWQAKSGGKRGGVRVIYFAGIENYVHLMTIYGKNVKENMKVRDLKKLKEVLVT